MSVRDAGHPKENALVKTIRTALNPPEDVQPLIAGLAKESGRTARGHFRRFGLWAWFANLSERLAPKWEAILDHPPPGGPLRKSGREKREMVPRKGFEPPTY